MDLYPIVLSIQVATVATIVVAVLGLGLALLFARTQFPWKRILETIVTLPLILPPTVVGYYLLFVIGRNGFPGGLLSGVGMDITFTWVAAVIASAVVALPLMVRTSQAAIESVDTSLEKAARTLGSPGWKVLLEITVPLAKRGLIAGLVLAFARAMGEFGATLMVAGNIPGRTQTVPLAIYTAVQTGHWTEANILVGIMTAIAFIVLFAVGRAQVASWGTIYRTKPRNDSGETTEATRGVSA
jgi:molybdate transport system permease protein